MKLDLAREGVAATASATFFAGVFLAGTPLARCLALLAGLRRLDVRAADFLRLGLIAILTTSFSKNSTNCTKGTYPIGTRADSSGIWGPSRGGGVWGKPGTTKIEGVLDALEPRERPWYDFPWNPGYPEGAPVFLEMRLCCPDVSFDIDWRGSYSVKEPHHVKPGGHLVNRLISTLVMVLIAASSVCAAETTSIAGVWVALVGDTMYTLRLWTESVDTARTIELFAGTVTRQSAGAGGVATRALPVTGQWLNSDGSIIVMSFGEPGNQREFGVGKLWTGEMELTLFSIRPGRSIDFQGAAYFLRQSPTTPSPPRN